MLRFAHNDKERRTQNDSGSEGLRASAYTLRMTQVEGFVMTDNRSGTSSDPTGKRNPKHEIRNTKQYQSTNDQNSKQNEFCYLDLEF